MTYAQPDVDFRTMSWMADPTQRSSFAVGRQPREDQMEVLMQDETEKQTVVTPTGIKPAKSVHKADTVTDLTKLETVKATGESNQQDLLTAVMETTDMDNLALVKKIRERLEA